MCVYLRSRLLHGSTTSITSRTYDDVPEISRDYCLSQTILNTCTSDKYDSFMGRHMSAKYGVCRPKNTHHKLVSPALDGGLLLRHVTWWMTSSKECSGFYISVVAVCCALTV